MVFKKPIGLVREILGAISVAELMTNPKLSELAEEIDQLDTKKKISWDMVPSLAAQIINRLSEWEKQRNTEVYEIARMSLASSYHSSLELGV